MNDKQKPSIRFKGFTEAWEQRKLGELGEIVTGSTPSTTHAEYYSDDGIPWVTPTDINATLIFDTPKKLSDSGAKIGRVVPANTILCTCIASIGKNALLTVKGSFNQQINGLTPNKKHDSYFLLTESGLWSNIMKRMAASGTMQIVNKAEFSELQTMVPSLSEQQQIGSFFANLDNLITLHQRKYDKLVNVKKSMLEKMFPRDGKNVPEIRFSGFTEAWEQRKFSDLVQIERGGSPRPIEDYITNSSEGLNWVKIGDAPIQGNYITRTAEKIRPEGLSKTREVHPGDLILSNSMSFGKPYIMGIDGCIHDGWLLIRDIQKVFDLTFLCHLLGTPQMLEQYRSFAAGSTVNNLNKELVGNTVVTIPNISEQRLLGQYFEQLDHLITLHQREVEKLQNIKKSCLEKMFA
ncbi:restriction endonuclease subunit S [[Clostridium] innocuum]|nr:restriction endonuclease subunit S [[Clostridium] innocuum]